MQAGGLNLHEAFGGDPVNRWDFLGLNDMSHVPTYGTGDEELDALFVTGSNLSALAAAQFHMQNRGRILSLRRDGMSSVGAQHEYSPPYTNWSLVDKPGPPNRRNEQFLGDGKVYDLDPVEVVARPSWWQHVDPRLLGLGTSGSFAFGFRGNASWQWTASFSGGSIFDLNNYRIGYLASTSVGGVSTSVGADVSGAITYALVGAPEDLSGMALNLGLSGGTPVQLGLDIGNLGADGPPM